MIDIKELECSGCKKPCMPAFSILTRKITLYRSDVPYFSVFTVFCGSCLAKSVDERDKKMLLCREEAHDLLNAIVYLTNVAPEDELKLLNFGKWNPNICPKCDTPTPLNGFRIEECTDCKLPRTDEILFFCTVLSKLSSSFMDGPYERVKRECTLSANEFLPCIKCASVATRFSVDGSLYCAKCSSPDDKLIDPKLLWHFNQFIRCVADSRDLSLLTYSKWTPFRCRTCAIPFSAAKDRTPFYHSKGRTTRCARCFEKDGCSHTGPDALIRLQFIVTAVEKLERYFNVPRPEDYDEKLLHDNTDIRRRTRERFPEMLT